MLPGAQHRMAGDPDQAGVAIPHICVQAQQAIVMNDMTSAHMCPVVSEGRRTHRPICKCVRLAVPCETMGR
jgi:hypothetical protein